MGDTEEFKKKIFLLYQFGRQSLIFAFEYVEILPKIAGLIKVLKV